MMTINGVDFSEVSRDAIRAAKMAVNDGNAWHSLHDIIENITHSLTKDVQLIASRKASGEFNENDARVFLEDQKMIARIRIRSVAIIGMELAERVWNAIATVFAQAIRQAIDWTVL